MDYTLTEARGQRNQLGGAVANLASESISFHQRPTISWWFPFLAERWTVFWGAQSL